MLCDGVCSYDLIFSNGLLMYMTDNEVHSLFTKALSWLRPGGFMFFRETCFSAHGTVFNCTCYRLKSSMGFQHILHSFR